MSAPLVATIVYVSGMFKVISFKAYHTGPTVYYSVDCLAITLAITATQSLVTSLDV